MEFVPRELQDETNQIDVNPGIDADKFGSDGEKEPTSGFGLAGKEVRRLVLERGDLNALVIPKVSFQACFMNILVSNEEKQNGAEAVHCILVLLEDIFEHLKPGAVAIKRPRNRDNLPAEQS